jgi:hypothetical protein
MVLMELMFIELFQITVNINVKLLVNHTKNVTVMVINNLIDHVIYIQMIIMVILKLDYIPKSLIIMILKAIKIIQLSTIKQFTQLDIVKINID